MDCHTKGFLFFMSIVSTTKRQNFSLTQVLQTMCKTDVLSDRIVCKDNCFRLKYVLSYIKELCKHFKLNNVASILYVLLLSAPSALIFF